jgi:uncharacterized protein (TIGR00369 family)
MSTPTLSLQDIQHHFDNSPYIRTLGLQTQKQDLEAGTLTVAVPWQAHFERGAGTRQWHGGPLAGIIDTVGDFALAQLLGRGLPTINFRVDYLRPAVGTDLTAVAQVRRNGRSVGVVDVDLFDQQQRLVATGRASYATLSP